LESVCVALVPAEDRRESDVVEITQSRKSARLRANASTEKNDQPGQKSKGHAWGDRSSGLVTSQNISTIRRQSCWTTGRIRGFLARSD